MRTLLMVGGLIVSLVALWLLGRFDISRSATRLRRDRATLLQFHNDITDFENNGLTDMRAFDRLSVDCPKVVQALGWDNRVHGVTIGPFYLNGVTILPKALYLLRDTMQSRFDNRGCYQIIEAVRGVLLNSLGRHDLALGRVLDEANNPVTAVLRGWSQIVAMPLHVLRGAGLLSSRQTSTASSSLLFRLVSFVTFLAALAGPILAYLADRSAIEKEVGRIAARSERQVHGGEPSKPVTAQHP